MWDIPKASELNCCPVIPSMQNTFVRNIPVFISDKLVTWNSL